MTDNYIGFQLKFSSGVKSPLAANNSRTTLLNLQQLLRGVNKGVTYKEGTIKLMVQDTLVQASATATPVSVVNGNTITIAGQALTAAQRRATATATCSTVLENTTLVVNGVTFTAVNGAVVLGEATFDCSGSDTACATSIAAQVNGYASPLISGIVAAKSASGVVTLYAVTQGTAGNSITLTSSDGATLAVTGSGFLANGAALANNTFDFAGTDITTGQALAAAINASTTAAVKRTVATVDDSTGVVTITAKVAGPAGNAITLTSVGGTITVTGSGFLASGSAGEPTLYTL